MLDINDPNTEKIFKVSGYIDRIKGMTSQYILQDFEERTETFLKMMIECEELVEFSIQHFPKENKEIQRECDKITQEVEKLMKEQNPFKAGYCTVCLSKIFSFNPGYKSAIDVHYCEKCPKEILNSLNALEMLTGVWAI